MRDFWFVLLTIGVFLALELCTIGSERLFARGSEADAQQEAKQ